MKILRLGSGYMCEICMKYILHTNCPEIYCYCFVQLCRVYLKIGGKSGSKRFRFSHNGPDLLLLGGDHQVAEVHLASSRAPAALEDGEDRQRLELALREAFAVASPNFN